MKFLKEKWVTGDSGSWMIDRSGKTLAWNVLASGIFRWLRCPEMSTEMRPHHDHSYRPYFWETQRTLEHRNQHRSVGKLKLWLCAFLHRRCCFWYDTGYLWTALDIGTWRQWTDSSKCEFAHLISTGSKESFWVQRLGEMGWETQHAWYTVWPSHKLDIFSHPTVDICILNSNHCCIFAAVTMLIG